MARFWTCRTCGTRSQRIKQRCPECGRPRPKAPTQSEKALKAPYAAWVERCGETCGICGKPPKEGRKLHRDHDHVTQRERGLLCFPCNSALRSYMTVDWLRAALAYLEQYEEEEAA